MAQKIQIRRGLDSQRTAITPDVGELLYTTDLKQVFIGDGATPGGVFISSGSSAGLVRKNSGTVPLTAGIDVITITGLTLSSVPSQILLTVRKLTGGANLFATVRGDTITASGFTADLSAPTDAATYKLDYLAIV